MAPQTYSLCCCWFDRGGSCHGRIFVCGRASIAVCDRSGGGVADIAVSDYYRVMGAGLAAFRDAPLLELGLPLLEICVLISSATSPSSAVTTTHIISTFSS